MDKDGIHGDTLNDELATSFVTLTANVQRLSEADNLVIQGVLKGMETDIVQTLQDNPDMTQYRKARYNALLSQTRDTIRANYTKISDLHQTMMEEAGQLSASATGKIFESVGLPLQSVIVTEEQWAAIAKASLVQGLPSSAWWRKQSQSLQDAFLQQMRIGYASGESIDQLVQRVRGKATGKRNAYIINGKKRMYVEYKGGIMDTGTRQAAALVRTSIMKMSADAKMEMFRKNADILKGVMWLATLDNRTSQLCASRSGKLYTLEGKPIGHDLSFLGGIPAHFNCYVLGENIVAPVGNATAFYRRLYSGDIYVIRCSDKSSFSVTPEHPVFTLRGWIPAKELATRDFVIRQMFTARGTYTPKTSIEQVSSGERRLTVPVLHMQSPTCIKRERPDGCVSYMLADRALFEGRAGLESMMCPTDQSLMDELLARKVIATDAAEVPAIDYACDDQTTQCCQDLSQGQNPIGSMETGQVWLFGLDHVHGCPASCGFDALCADGVGLAYFGAGRPVYVEIVSISDITVKQYSGPVENLACDTFDAVASNNGQVGNGCYFLNGILVHNCRSTLVPVTKSFAELGDTPGIDTDYLEAISDSTQASMTGSVPQDMTFDTWFRTLPEDDQRAYLGPGKYNIWKKAGLNFEDMVDKLGNPLTIEQLAKAYDVKIKTAEKTGIPNVPKEMVSAIAVEQEAQLIASKRAQEEDEKAKAQWDKLTGDIDKDNASADDLLALDIAESFLLYSQKLVAYEAAQETLKKLKEQGK